MNILVTGGAGFIGSHLCEKLLALGHAVTCLDNFHNFYDPNIKRENLAACRASDRFRLIEADIRDMPRLRSTFSSGGFDMAVHLAAIAGVRQSIQNPFAYEEVNVRGLFNVLEVCREASVKKFVFASSSSVYGVGLAPPFKETMAAGRCASPYAATKHAGESVCHAYHHVHGIAMAVLRYFTVFGPRQRPEMAIHRFVRKTLEGGAIRRFGDGSMERDFTYIDDAIAGTVAAAERCEGYEVYNIAGGKSVTLTNLIKMIEKTLEIEVKIEEAEVAAGDVPVTRADIAKAKLKLGYKPAIDLKEGLRLFAQWARTRYPAAGET